MGSDVIEFAGWIWAGLATIGAVAAAIIRWRSSSDETTAALWKEEAAAWKAKAERLDSSLAALEKRVEHLESENKMLRALHDNREEMISLRIAITEGFSDLKTTIRSNNL